MEMEWTETEKGGLKLLLDGFVYVKKKNLANGWESYECELRRNRNMCKARVKVLGADQFRDKTEHNHPPDHGKANAYKLKAAMKRRAIATDESPQQILMTAIHQATEEGLMALPGPTNMRRIIRRQRQDHRESLATRKADVLEIPVDQRSALSVEGGLIVPSEVHSVRRNDGDGNDLQAPKDQKSPFGIVESLMAHPLVESVCGDDQEGLVIGNEKDPEDQISSSSKEGAMAPSEPDNMRNDSREALGLAIKNTEGLEVPEDQMSPLNVEKDQMTLPGLDNMRQNNILETLAIRNSEDLEGPEEHKSSLATGEGPKAMLTLDKMRRIMSRKQQNDPEALSVPMKSAGLELKVSQEILVRPLHSTLMKRSFAGHQSTGPRAKVPTGPPEIGSNLPVTSPSVLPIDTQRLIMNPKEPEIVSDHE